MGVPTAITRRLSGYTRQNLSKLIAQYRAAGSLKPVSRASRTSFSGRFGAADIALLGEIDSPCNRFIERLTTIPRTAYESG
jgi:hypothetical protein